MGVTYQDGRWVESPEAPQAAPTSVPNAVPNGQLGGTNSSGTPTGGSTASNWSGGSGFFKYGTGKYGFINKTGGISWKADPTKAAAGRQLSWQKVMPYASGHSGYAGAFGRTPVSGANTFDPNKIGPTASAPGAPDPLASASAPAPAAWDGGSGFFQYGDGQYGFINDTGGIAWGVKTPEKNARMLNWNAVSKFANSKGATIPQQKATPAAFTDPQYFRNMAEENYNLDEARRASKDQLADWDEKYGVATGQLHKDFMRNFYDSNAQMAGAGFYNSGARELGDVDRHTATTNALGEMNRSMGPLAKQREMARLKLVEDRYKTVKEAELAGARNRWKALNPGKKIPKVESGFEQKNGQWSYTSKDGVRVSLGKNTPKGVALRNVRKLYSVAVRKHGSGSAQARRYRQMLQKIRKWEV